MLFLAYLADYRTFLGAFPARLHGRKYKRFCEIYCRQAKIEIVKYVQLSSEMAVFAQTFTLLIFRQHLLLFIQKCNDLSIRFLVKTAPKRKHQNFVNISPKPLKKLNQC